MDKNTILALGLSFVVLAVSLFVQNKYIVPKQEEKMRAQAAEEAVQKELEASRLNEEHSLISSFRMEAEEGSSEFIPEKEYTITTNKVKVVFTNRGGDIVSYKLLDHKDKDSGEGVEMASNIRGSNRAFGLSFGGWKGLPLDDTFNCKIKDDKTILFHRDYDVKDSAGVSHKVTVGKKYTFVDDDYVFKLDVSLISEDGSEISVGGSAYTLRTSPQIGPRYDKKNRYEMRQVVALNGTKKFKKSVSGKTFNTAYDWAGIAGKYFTLLVKPVNGNMVNSLTASDTSFGGEIDSQLFLTRLPVAGGSVNDSYYVYIGPRNETDLIKYNTQDKNKWSMINARFDYALQTSGFLSWIEVGLKWCMDRIFRIVHNWGVAIIILTVLLKIVLFPLSKNSAEGSVKMQALQPKIKALQDKYGNDQTKLGPEMQKLYKEAGYNPMSGCLPMAAQMVILFALYNVFNNYFEFRGAGFINGWIEDLSVGDSVWTWNREIPLISGFTMNNLRLLPFIYTASQLLNGKITQFGSAGASSNSQMKFMMYGMPLMFFFMFYNVPSGLLLYWTVSNILQIGQQLVINSIMKKKRAELEKNSKPVNKNELKFKGGKKKTR